MYLYAEAGDFTYLIMSIREDSVKAALLTSAIEDVGSTHAAYESFQWLGQRCRPRDRLCGNPNMEQLGYMSRNRDALCG